MTKRGFTLIETFGAITILIMAVLGPLALLVRSISDAEIIKNQITASYLAQEAIELVINRRDYNYKDAAAYVTYDASGENANSPDRYYWLAGLNSCMGANAVCALSVPTGDVVQPAVSCADPADQSLCDIPELLGGTKFHREITIEPFNAINPSGEIAAKEYFGAYEGAKVTVTLKWKFKGNDKHYVLSTIIYSPSVSEKDVGNLNF